MGVEYYYCDVFYKLGEGIYALYYFKGTWKESTKITNDLLIVKGTRACLKSKKS